MNLIFSAIKHIALICLLLGSLAKGVFSQSPTCVELARVGWYELDKTKRENYFYYNLVRTLRTERYRDFGVASKFLSEMSIPIEGFMVPFSFAGDFNGWAKFQDVSDSYLFERIQTYSDYWHNRITINPAVVDAVKTCIQQDGVFITLGRSGDPNEFPLIANYVGVAGIPNVRLNLNTVQNRLRCPQKSYTLSAGQQVTFTCVRSVPNTNLSARIDFNVNKSRIRTDSSWVLPGAGSAKIVTPPELTDNRQVRIKSVCFKTREENKDHNTYAYANVKADGLEYASWAQPNDDKFGEGSDRCFGMANPQPLPLSLLQQNKAVLEFGIKSTVGDDTWKFEPRLNIQIDGESGERTLNTNQNYERSEGDVGKSIAWTLPKQAVSPPPAPPAVAKTPKTSTTKSSVTKPQQKVTSRKPKRPHKGQKPRGRAVKKTRR